MQFLFLLNTVKLMLLTGHAALHVAAFAALGRCFSSPGNPAHDYTDGDWVPFTHHRYKILAHFWEQLGTTIKSSTPQNYGRCDRVTPNRILYEWQPHRCKLEQFSVHGVCEVLRGKSLLMVGDSTVFQLWLSFALLLGAQLGKNVKKASTVSEITASACGDATRLAFVRNDLVLYTSNVGDLMSAKRCDGFLSMQVTYPERMLIASLMYPSSGDVVPECLPECMLTAPLRSPEPAELRNARLMATDCL